MRFLNSDDPDNIYNDLAAKWLEGQLSAEEEKEFLDWYNQLQDKPVSIPVSFAGSRQMLRDRMLKNIKKQIRKENKVVRLRVRFQRMAAAVLITAVALSAYYFTRMPAATVHTLAQQQAASVKNVRHHDRAAILTLSDGSSIPLDQASNGTLAKQGSATIVKLSSGRLQYRRPDGHNSIEAVGYNTITTPKGGQYQIILPDNTNVWLNASSSLRFPTAFTGDERNVELTGEGYFEVAKNKDKPFEIKVNELAVTVLGTHFNIMAYNEEEAVNTTLLEGAVKVTKGNAEKLLKPGEQARLDKEHGSLKVYKDVNTDQAVAWRTGDFRFENAKVKTIMRQIARWYDVTMEYDEGLRDIGLTGSISRSNTVPQLLEILEATHRVHFTQQGNRIKISTTGGRRSFLLVRTLDAFSRQLSADLCRSCLFAES